MPVPLNNPQRLLLALDDGLDHEVVLVLYGRAALVLGYDGAPVEMGATKDVDAVIQLREVEALANDEPFWDARDAVNAQFNGTSSQSSKPRTPIFPVKSRLGARLAAPLKLHSCDYIRSLDRGFPGQGHSR